ncbi:phage tail protein [Aestuariispira ectoiniformans]|uniref:phage tail protein n=1 Tax=Aestuariispira ectoiniformans TaxID=2775080 RepID=UPI00223C28BC|nr:tail fiber protein [Aestuariispira ectoiniformans]
MFEHKNLKFGAATLMLAAGYFMMDGALNPAKACGDNTYIGSVCSFAGNFCPDNYLPAEGQVLVINSNPALYAVMGDAFGGDGRTTFALPDLRGRTPVGLGQSYYTTVKLGTKRGVEQTALAKDQLPAHNHMAQLSGAGQQELAVINVSKANANVETPSTGDYLAAPAYESFVSAANAGTAVPLSGGSSGAVVSGPLNVQNAGSGAAFNIETPYQAATYCIRVHGLFPPRN